MRLALLAASSLLACACGLGPQKVDESRVRADQKALAQRLAERIYEGCNAKRFEPLTEGEATAAMRDGLAPDKQASVCADLSARFGEYQSMSYAETWSQHGLAVYRFHGRFAKASEPLEIRVVIDAEDKLSGFWLKPWQDELR